MRIQVQTIVGLLITMLCGGCITTAVSRIGAYRETFESPRAVYLTPDGSLIIQTYVTAPSEAKGERRFLVFTQSQIESAIQHRHPGQVTVALTNPRDMSLIPSYIPGGGWDAHLLDGSRIVGVGRPNVPVVVRYTTGSTTGNVDIAATTAGVYEAPATLISKIFTPPAVVLDIVILPLNFLWLEGRIADSFFPPQRR